MKFNQVTVCLLFSIFTNFSAASSLELSPPDSSHLTKPADSTSATAAKSPEKRSDDSGSTVTSRNSIKGSATDVMIPGKTGITADSTSTAPDSSKKNLTPAKTPDATPLTTDSLHSTLDLIKKTATDADVPAKSLIAADSLHVPDDSVNKRETTVIVKGKQGQALAQSKQQNADNLKNVIDAELIAKLPDQTTADALQRVPGISIDRDNGEGHYVMIRGTEANLSTVTINGQSISGTDADTRAVGLNVIPSDQLAQIEVTKVLMPEMDADAIGGTVNLITNTAKDSVTRINLKFTPGYSQMSGQPIWDGSLSGGRRFLNNALGVFAGGSYDHEVREQQGIAMTWDTTLILNTNDSENNAANRHLWSLMFRDYQRDDERVAGNAKIDYRFSSQARIYLSGSTNFSGDQEERQSLLLDMHNGDAEAIGATPGSGDNLVENVPVTRSVKDAYTSQSISSVTLGGATPLFNTKADGSVSYSFGETNQPDQLTGAFQRQNETFLFNPSNVNDPQFTPINLTTYQMDELLTNKEVFQTDSTFNNPGSYTMSSMELKTKNIKENSISGQINVTAEPIPLFNGDASLDLKTGVKGTEHTKSQWLKVISFEDSGSYQFPNLSNFLGDYSNNSFFNDQYTLNNMPSAAMLRDYLSYAHGTGNNFLFADSTHSQLEVDPQTFTAIDRNAAAFFQGTMKWDKLTVVGGVRCEFTSMHYSGYQDSAIGYDNAIVYTLPLEMYRSFFFPLPMVLGRYAFDKYLDARLSYTHSFARPDWLDLVPTRVFTNDDGQERVDQGNPDLKPTQAHNVDASIEYYPNSQDMFSFGAFYKKMEDYIFNTYEFYENAINSPYANSGAISSGSHEPLQAYTKENGNYADLAGCELSVMQRFFFLPGFLSGFGINANYCFTWSQTLIPGLSEYTTLPGQSNHVGNVALFYEKYGLSARVALNIQSPYIYELDSYINPTGQVVPLPNYCDTHAQIDCSLSQRISSHVTAMISFNDINDAPNRLFLDNPNYPTQIEYYSWTVRAGVKVNLNL